MRVCLVLLEDRPGPATHDLLLSARQLAPDFEIFWYDSSAGMRHEHGCFGATRLDSSRPLKYAKVTPFFFDALEWFVANGDFDLMINIESDMVFTGSGLSAFFAAALRDHDYMVPRLQRNVSVKSKWRPYRSLRKELPELAEILGHRALHGGFSPGQVFTRRYADKVLSAPFYAELRRFIDSNQGADMSFTLQEILLPTLGGMWDLRARDYPEADLQYIRYRPYHSVASYRKAVAIGSPFVHPISRDEENNTRIAVRERFRVR